MAKPSAFSPARCRCKGRLTTNRCTPRKLRCQHCPMHHASARQTIGRCPTPIAIARQTSTSTTKANVPSHRRVGFQFQMVASKARKQYEKPPHLRQFFLLNISLQNRYCRTFAPKRKQPTPSAFHL